jgi:phage terminase large subunit
MIIFISGNSSYDNPYLPKEEIDKAKEELTEDRFAQEYMGDFRKTEGLVYKEFVREQHVVAELQDMNMIILGIDYGYTNPAAILKIGVDADNNYYVMHEWYKTKQTTEQIAEVAKGMGSNMCYPDIAEPDRIEILKIAGLNCRETNKEVESGIDTVRELLKQKRLFIYKSCKNLIWEFETYHYPDRKPGKNEQEKPVKENDHAMDALRYALHTHKPSQWGYDFDKVHKQFYV